MEPSVEKMSKKSSGLGVFFGCISALYALICLCLGIYASIFHQQISTIPNYFLKIAPTPSSTPIVHQLTAGDKVYKDNFLDNTGLWSGIGSNSEVSIKDGKLFLKSLHKGASGFAECGKCPKLTSPYFIQADFSTLEPTDERYGIAFSADDSYPGDDALGSCYLFQIDAKNGSYELYKFLNSTWILHISRNSDSIKPHPETNTLGVSMDNDLIVFLINGEIVDTYQDSGTTMNFGYYWVFGNDAGFTLILDNLYTYGK